VTGYFFIAVPITAVGYDEDGGSKRALLEQLQTIGFQVINLHVWL